MPGIVVDSLNGVYDGRYVARRSGVHTVRVLGGGSVAVTNSPFETTVRPAGVQASLCTLSGASLLMLGRI